MNIFETLKIYKNPKVVAIAVLSIISGYLLPLSVGTMQLWLQDSKVDIETIGLFGMVGIPYALKFLWAPLLDQVKLGRLTEKLGRRRSWLLIIEILVMVVLLMLAFSNPSGNLIYIASLAVTLAFLSASQDVVIDAYRTELLPAEEVGAGASASMFGYNIGMRFIGGALALLVADVYGWQKAYLVMACIAPLGFIVTLFAGEIRTEFKKTKNYKEWLENAFIAPFKDFMKHSSWQAILLFVIFFKFADAFAGMMTNPFLREIGFTKTELAFYLKVIGTIATFLGMFAGGILATKVSQFKALWICGILQALTNLLFVWQDAAGHNGTVLMFVIGGENFVSMMGNVVFVAYITKLCNRNYTATQYALLSALATVGRTVLSSFSGFVVADFGWSKFFIITALMAIPGLIMLLWLQTKKAFRSLP
jgi:MFS transporter, PAT family, beta-lactamase induction signal transducer AmpG